MADEFYLQDSRSYVGNDVLWWQVGGGYTSDVSKAEVFTRDIAQRRHDVRPTDIPWPKAYIDARTRPAVDMQYIRREEALEGSGVVLVVPVNVRKEPMRCHVCGGFINERQVFSSGCPKCGADNRP
jgi:hypothetical protein